jgi:hypothetical protein
MVAHDRTTARHYHFEHCSRDAAPIAATQQGIGKPPAHSELLLRLPLQPGRASRDWLPPSKLPVSFFVELIEGRRKRSSVRHRGCGVALIHDGIRLNNDFL